MKQCMNKPKPNKQTNKQTNKRSKLIMSNDDYIKEVYQMLKNRDIHPSGEFDKAGRWSSDNSDLINVRTPSRAYPYSEMTACRTLKYTKAVAIKFNCTNKSQLLEHI